MRGQGQAKEEIHDVGKEKGVRGGRCSGEWLAINEWVLTVVSFSMIH